MLTPGLSPDIGVAPSNESPGTCKPVSQELNKLTFAQDNTPLAAQSP